MLELISLILNWKQELSLTKSNFTVIPHLMRNLKINVKEVFIKYYLPVLAFTIAFSVPTFIVNYDGSKLIEFLVACISLNVIITFVFGTLYLKFGKNWKSKFRRKVLNKKALKSFEALGFVRQEEMLYGYIDDYFIMIQPEMDALGQKKWLDIKVFFNPKIQNQFIPEYLLKKLNDNKLKQTFFNKNCVVIEQAFAPLVPLNFDRMRAKLKEVVSLLKNHNIMPISMTDLIEQKTDLLKYHQQIQSLYK